MIVGRSIWISGKVVEAPLHHGGVIRIGRDGANDIVLSGGGVSRFHARISWFGEEPLLTDLHSYNGTRVNGMSVSKACLSLGAKIAVGGHSLRVSHEKRPPCLLANPDDRVTLFSDSGSTFQGDLGQLRLHDLLAQLEQDRRTGSLRINTRESTLHEATQEELPRTQCLHADRVNGRDRDHCDRGGDRGSQR